MGWGAGDVDLMERLIELLGTVLIESNTRHRRVMQTKEIGLANLRTPEGEQGEGEEGGVCVCVCVWVCVCVCVCVCMCVWLTWVLLGQRPSVPAHTGQGLPSHAVC